MEEEGDLLILGDMRELKGFLLIEVAITLCALGILTSMVVPLVQTVATRTRRAQTQRASKLALRALAIYVETHGWLPYAANPETGDSVPGLFVGILPYRTLCLDRQHTLDGRGRPLVYVVCPNLTQAPPRNPLHLVQGSSPTFMTVSRDDSLNVFDGNGVPVLPPIEDKDFCAVVVMSSEFSKNGGAIRESENGIEVILPSHSAALGRWVSRNNLLSVFGN